LSIVFFVVGGGGVVQNEKRVSSWNQSEGGKGEVLLREEKYGIELRKGECVGIFGIAGNGQRDLFDYLARNYRDILALGGNLVRFLSVPELSLLENYIVLSWHCPSFLVM